MKVTTFAKAGVSIAAAATLSLGVFANAAHATSGGPTATQEDPTGNGTLVGVGSDTIQDVMYGISQDLNTRAGSNFMSSYTATGTGTITYRSGLQKGSGSDPTNPRPNGSGPGYKALEDSMGVTNAGNAHIGDVDFSRASGTQGTAVSTTTTYTTDPQEGVITEIPFAIDSISFAVPAGSPFLNTNGGKGLTEANLADIYDGTDKYIGADGTLSTAALDASYKPINAFLPKGGSGSRQFFLKGLNAVDPTGIPLGSNKGDSFGSTATPSSASPAPYVGAVNYNGAPVEEHDATVLTSAPSTVAAIAPFSGAKFLGYHNGKIADPDTGKTAGSDYVLVPFDSVKGTSTSEHPVLPYVGDASNPSAVLTPNSAYISDAQETDALQGGGTGTAKLTREVYNIIPTAAVAHPTANAKFKALYDTFVGSDSSICQDSGTIAAYGFMTDPVCGTTGWSADNYGTSTFTVTPQGSAVAGGSMKFLLSGSTVGNSGGTATVTVNGKAYTKTIPAATSATATAATAILTVPTPKAGTFHFGAPTDGFIPALPAAAPSQESQAASPGSYTVKKATAKVAVKAPAVKHTVAGKVTVTVTAAGLHPTGKITVLVKKGTAKKFSATKSLVSGKAVVTLKKLPVGKYSVYVSYTGDSNINKVASKKYTTLTVK